MNIIAYGIAGITDSENPEIQNRFRKASRQMLMSLIATERALRMLPEMNSDLRQNMGLIVGSSHGELEVTKNFLKDLAVNNIARPILFQNSLHNSTLGFLSLNLGIHGPGITVSHRFFSGEEALEIGVLQLHEQKCDLCLVVGVEDCVPEIEGPVSKIYPNGICPTAGAAAILMATDEGLKKLNTKPVGAKLTGVFRLSASEKIADLNYFKHYYDSNAIEVLCDALSKPNHSSECFISLSHCFVPKPDGTSSRISFEKTIQR